MTTAIHDPQNILATEADWRDVPTVPRVGQAAGAAKVRITRLGKRQRPVGILSRAALDWYEARGMGWVRVQRSSVQPRMLRFLGVRAAEAGALRINVRARTIGGARLVALAPPGTDIILTELGDALVGMLPEAPAADGAE